MSVTHLGGGDACVPQHCFADEDYKGNFVDEGFLGMKERLKARAEKLTTIISTYSFDMRVELCGNCSNEN